MAMLRRSTVILAKSGIVHCKRTNCLAVKLSFIDLSIPVVKEKTIRKQDHISCQEVPLKEYFKRRRTALDSISKITDPEVRGEVKGIVNMLLIELDGKEDYATELLMKLQKTDDEKNHERAENLKHIIMPLMRTEFEEFEQLYLPAIQLSKQDMIQNLKKSYASLSIPSSIAKVEELSIHYVSMMYILKNSTDTRVLTFKNYLNKKGIDDDNIARVSEIFYKKSSAATHDILVDLSIEDVELGLRKNGISDNVKLSVVKALFAIQRDKINELN